MLPSMRLKVESNGSYRREKARNSMPIMLNFCAARPDMLSNSRAPLSSKIHRLDPRQD